jgi:hypothetical protein
MKKAYAKALDRYIEVCTPFSGSLNQPSRSLSTVSSNGTTFFRNTNGLLAVVTSTGKVFDRIGGPRLDVEEDTGSAA